MDCMSTVIPQQWIARQQEDLTYYSMYRKELDYLRKQDTIVPETLEIPDNGMPGNEIPWYEWQQFYSVNLGNTW